MSYSKEEKQREEKMFPTSVRYREIDGKLYRKASRRAQNMALTFRGFNRWSGNKKTMADIEKHAGWPGAGACRRVVLKKERVDA